MQYWVRFGLFLTLLLVVGCQSAGVDPRPPEARAFEVELQVPDSLRADEPFRLQGVLVNTSKEPQEISHGLDLFRYIIHDSNGNQVSDGHITYLPLFGYSPELQPQEVYLMESHLDNILQSIQERSLPAGKYNVTALAFFIVKTNGANIPVEWEAGPFEINIEP